MKNFLLILFGFALIFSLSACGKTDTATPRGFDRRMPDFGQPESDANLSGLVRSIVGNEVTILKIERPQFNREKGTEQGTETTSEDKQRTALSFGGASGGTRPESGMMGRRQSGDSDNSSMLEMLKEMSPGEEKVIIPVGIQMLKREETSERGTPNMIAATLEDIKQDSMLMIWLDDSINDRKVAKFVVIN